MVVVSETKESQLLALLEQCVHLDADVRPRKEKGFFTVTVPPPWNDPARRAAQAIQDQIKEWSKQYPNVVCYCFDGYSKEELEADQKADAEKAEREERLRREQEHQKKCERLEQTYDGTMSSLKEFTKSFYYDRDVKEALDMVYEKLREQPAGCAAAFEADELEHFFKLCGDLARNNPGEEQKILNMARTMMGGLAA